MEWIRIDYAKKLIVSSVSVLITAGAGDIDTLLIQIKERLEKSL
jgi:hypothetical protein